MAEKKRKATAGSFRAGPDPRRHHFTPSESRVGWLVANIKHPHLREWLKMRLRYHYRRKEASNGQQPQEEGHGDPDGGIPF
jgi:hypothetical protein